MKTLRTITFVILLTIGCLLFAGCNNKSSENTLAGSQEKREDKEFGDTTNRKDLTDSIKSLSSQIHNLTNAKDVNEKKISELSNKISDLKDSYRLFDLISWIVSAIAILLSILIIVQLNPLTKRVDRHHEDIDDLRYKVNNLERYRTPANTQSKITNSNLCSKEYSELLLQIRQIKLQLNKIDQKVNQYCEGVDLPNQSTGEARSNNEHTGYFNLPTRMSPTDAYFRRLSEVRDTDSRFKVVVQGNIAEFKPLEGPQYLNDLKSNDAIKIALEIQGCAPSEATQMRIVAPGEVKKDGDRWMITKKAIIAFS